MKRFQLLAWISGAMLLAGSATSPAVAAKSPATALVRAGTDIVIDEVRTYAPGDQVGGTNDEYYVVKFKFTNDLGFALAPKINHFIIEDLQRRRFLGVETGNSALIGISNYDGILKVGDSHDYTVGFRVPLNTLGILVYDPTF